MNLFDIIDALELSLDCEDDKNVVHDYETTNAIGKGDTPAAALLAYFRQLIEIANDEKCP